MHIQFQGENYPVKVTMSSCASPPATLATPAYDVVPASFNALGYPDSISTGMSRAFTASSRWALTAPSLALVPKQPPLELRFIKSLGDHLPRRVPLLRQQAVAHVPSWLCRE